MVKAHKTLIPGQVSMHEAGEVLYLEMRKAVLATAFDLVNKKSLTLYIEDISNLESLIQDFQSELKKIPTYQLKVVGQGPVFDSVVSSLIKMDLVIEKQLKSHKSCVQLYLYPELAKLRVKEVDEFPGPTIFSEPRTLASPQKLRVLVVDDSPTMQKFLVSLLEPEEDIEVVGVASRPSEVEALIKKTKPNVITLDINMPEMDGVELLKLLLPKYKIPTVMISSLSQSDGHQVMDALEVGAVDYIRKPAFSELDRTLPIMLEKIRSAAQVDVARLIDLKKSIVQKSSMSMGSFDTSRLIAIGASTGGPEALKSVLAGLPSFVPPIVIAQHIPPFFSKAMAERFNELFDFEVSEAVDGDLLEPNHVYVAPGGFQLRLRRASQGVILEANDSTPRGQHVPSVDVLFESVASVYGKSSIGVILTGMGQDGASGLLKLRSCGAMTIAQDEESSIIFGMPRRAIEIGAAEKVCSLGNIAREVMESLNETKKSRLKAISSS